MKKIILSQNWNQKQCCDAFIIIKPVSAGFTAGNKVLVETKLTKSIIEKVYNIVSSEYYPTLKDIPESIFYADTGLSKHEAVKLYQNAYKIDKGWNVLVLEGEWRC